MCGIAGFTTIRRSLPEVRTVLHGMIGPIQHRGPDAEGCYTDEGIALGHRRLSIIDLESGGQPMSVEGGRYTIVFNGEIYNYIELRKELEARGRRFVTRSDTEVVLQQYAMDGARALDRFNGMFAFALWDAKTQELFLARDRMGEKPLYYSICNGELVFASELKALLQYPGLERHINLLSVSKFLTFGYVPAPHTIYQGIHKLEPGQCLRFSSRACKMHTYWDIPLQDRPVSSMTVGESAERLVALLRTSVRQRLRSDVPVGIFLSGGIDSSAVTCLASQETGNKLSTFSIGFQESSYDESIYAKQVAGLYGTDHHHEVLSMSLACEMLPKVSQLMDEPFADASIIPTYLISRLARQSLKVVLGGDGSDELFIGYPSFVAHKVTESLSFLPMTWRDTLNRLAKKLPVSSSYASVDFLLQQYFKGAGISADARFLIWMGFCGNEQRNQLISDEAKNALLHDDPFEDVVRYARNSRLTDDFQRINYLCMKMYLQDGILVKVDRASMANSLEVRSPFLDHHLVAFACGIHPRYKLNHFTTKYILKKAMKGILPSNIIHRRKSGFMMPVAIWLMKDMRPLLEEVCSDEEIRRDGLFNPATVRRLIDEHMRRIRDHRKVLWSLLCFQLWKKNHAQGLQWNG